MTVFCHLSYYGDSCCCDDDDDNDGYCNCYYYNDDVIDRMTTMIYSEMMILHDDVLYSYLGMRQKADL